jgi:hypothetical protein
MHPVSYADHEIVFLMKSLPMIKVAEFSFALILITASRSKITLSHHTSPRRSRG